MEPREVWNLASLAQKGILNIDRTSGVFNRMEPCEAWNLASLALKDVEYAFLNTDSLLHSRFQCRHATTLKTAV